MTITSEMTKSHNPVGSFDQLCGETTLHGIKHIFDSKMSRGRRFFWTAIFITQFLLFLVMISFSFAHYLNYSVTRKITVVDGSSLVFPAVTICNYNQYRKSLIAGTAFEDILFQYYIFQRLNLPDQYRVDVNLSSFANVDYNSFLTAALPNISDFLMDCLWQSYYKCDARNFTVVKTDFGFCHTFNTQNTLSGVGYWNSLRFWLSVQEEEHSINFFNGVGFKIALHSPDEYPSVNEGSFTITPGLSASVSVEFQEERSLPAPYETKCGSRYLKYFKTYSYSNCKAEITYNMTIEKCGCLSYDMPESNNLSRCSLDDYTCIFYLDLSSASELCPPDCYKSRYIPSVTYSKFPDKITTKYMAIKYNTTEEYIRNNFVEGTIYFNSLRYERIDAIPTLSFDDLGAYIGGQMGLTIGASLLTVYEWIDWISAACIHKLKTRQNKRVFTINQK